MPCGTLFPVNELVFCFFHKFIRIFDILSQCIAFLVIHTLVDKLRFCKVLTLT